MAALSEIGEKVIPVMSGVLEIGGKVLAIGEQVPLVGPVFTMALGVMDALETASSNKETCQLLKKHIKMVMNSAEARLKEKADRKDELKEFVKEMGDILEKTQKVIEDINKTNALMRRIKSKDHEEKLQRVKERLDLLHKHASFLTLAKVYEDDHIKEATHSGSWDLAYEEVCLFCHVTKDGDVIIGGQREEYGEEWWEMKSYDQTGNEKWHWQCAPEIGQPSDMTTITRNGEEYMAILLQDLNKIVLLDQKINSLTRSGVYDFLQQDYRLRRIASVGSDRIVVSADPTVGASPSSQSHLKVLGCRNLPFSQKRTIQLECLDIHSLSRISNDKVAVACGRPESVHVFDIDQGHSKWHLEPTQMKGVEVMPQGVCAVGGDFCVYDGTGTRIVTASGGKWGEVLLSEDDLGDYVYSTSYSTASKKLVVLHEKDDKLRITLFSLK